MNHPMPRLIRSLPHPLGLYFRPGYGDHRALLALLAEGRSAFTGIVFEPSWENRQEELRADVLPDPYDARLTLIGDSSCAVTVKSIKLK